MSRSTLVNVVVVILVVWFEQSIALSQFRSDASFSIVDNDLNTTITPTMLASSTLAVTSTGSTSPTISSIPPSSSPSPSPSSSPSPSPSSSPSPSPSSSPSPSPSSSPSPSPSSSPSPSPSASPSSSAFPSSISTPIPSSPASTTPAATTPSVSWLQLSNPLSGFDVPTPVLLRGENGLDPATGVFNIVDDGFYVFLIHRVCVDDTNPALELNVLPNDGSSPRTLATLNDTGAATLFSVHVAAELQRNDRVVVANAMGADVVGDEENPFIYNAFLLYHKPISPFPRVRQSAFSATVEGNLTLAETTITGYDLPSVDINEDLETDTGIFSAPMRGVYIFHLDVTFVSPSLDVRAAMGITVNDQIRARVWARFDAPQWSKNTAVTIAQSLDQGDRVEVVNLIANPDLDCYVVFTGYLLG